MGPVGNVEAGGAGREDTILGCDAWQLKLTPGERKLVVDDAGEARTA